MKENEIKRILITGSCGAIGKILRKDLSERFNVVGLDKSGTGTDTLRVDVSNKVALENAFKKIGDVDTVVHLAAVSDHQADWADVLKNNINGTENIFFLSQKSRVRRVVFASSTHLFGEYPQYPDKISGDIIRVDSPRRPDGYYGLSKGFGEDLARYYYDRFGLQSISIRIGSVSNDDKPVYPYHLLWLSHRDLIQVFESSLLTHIKFGIYFAISVSPTIFDTEPTKRDLGLTSKS